MNGMIIKFVITTIIFLILDGIWLGFLSKNLYIDNIGSLLRIENGNIIPNWYAAVVVYIALITGIIFLVLPKVGTDPVQALIWGGFFGFVTYAAYDFTNLAVLESWSLKISIIDTIWGMILCGLTSFFTVTITNLISK